jgi:hypothetical protein
MAQAKRTKQFYEQRVSDEIARPAELRQAAASLR